MSRSFERSVEKVFGFEGGFADHADDPGGKTNFGITEDTLKEYDKELKVKDIDKDIAKKIYKQEYWDKSNLTQIAGLNEEIAFKIFDASVNIGVKQAVTFLQESLNVLNQNEKKYKDLKVDGILGKKTIDSFKSFWEERGKTGISVLIKAVNSLQGAYYISISAKNKKLQSFTYGWIKNRI